MSGKHHQASDGSRGRWLCKKAPRGATEGAPRIDATRQVTQKPCLRRNVLTISFDKYAVSGKITPEDVGNPTRGPLLEQRTPAVLLPTGGKGRKDGGKSKLKIRGNLDGTQILLLKLRWVQPTASVEKELRLLQLQELQQQQLQQEQQHLAAESHGSKGVDILSKLHRKNLLLL
ncbi:hypothetical protein EMWEY_00027190 [Eimeria maxima]|uniref:Uncharacterized protein n=1 Tax=Eimeria maxima TaxID=5804 RepID=U6M1I3_EIMMA|nr:hypothetical protein EMWEY_00027190 [Eimeria maxima]CDJ56953.1 hypothetical protein EMWEY_00027190 [Eimeria maxima]